MRVNVYSQELTDEISYIHKAADTGVTYGAVRLFLHSTPRLHNTASDDDRSAITFWLPKSKERRESFARALERMAAIIRAAPPDVGKD